VHVCQSASNFDPRQRDIDPSKSISEQPAVSLKSPVSIGVLAFKEDAYFCCRGSRFDADRGQYSTLFDRLSGNIVEYQIHRLLRRRLANDDFARSMNLKSAAAVSDPALVIFVYLYSILKNHLQLSLCLD